MYSPLSSISQWSHHALMIAPSEIHPLIVETLSTSQLPSLRAKLSKKLVHGANLISFTQLQWRFFIAKLKQNIVGQLKSTLAKTEIWSDVYVDLVKGWPAKELEVFVARFCQKVSKWCKLPWCVSVLPEPNLATSESSDKSNIPPAGTNSTFHSLQIFYMLSNVWNHQSGLKMELNIQLKFTLISPIVP